MVQFHTGLIYWAVFHVGLYRMLFNPMHEKTVTLLKQSRRPFMMGFYLLFAIAMIAPWWIFVQHNPTVIWKCFYIMKAIPRCPQVKFGYIQEHNTVWHKWKLNCIPPSSPMCSFPWYQSYSMGKYHLHLSFTDIVWFSIVKMWFENKNFYYRT